MPLNEMSSIHDFSAMITLRHTRYCQDAMFAADAALPLRCADAAALLLPPPCPYDDAIITPR